VSAYLYILRCSDGRYYVGLTRKTSEERVGEHNAGTYEGFTKARRPVVLVWSQEFQMITDAIAAERQIKRWSRAKKEAFICGRFDLLPELARRRRPFNRGDT
jgi:predicted GIY-YIG superfamily endonuclease